MSADSVRRTVVVGLAICLAAVGVAVLGRWLVDPGPDRELVRLGDGRPGGEPPAPPPGLQDGPVTRAEREPLPRATLEGFDGGEVRLADYRGRPLVLNFWATWCPPCLEEMPDFQQVASEVEGQAAFLGVNVQDVQANARAFVDELGITYDLALDPAAELYGQVRGLGMPTTLLVDPGGTVVFRQTGPVDAAGLRALLEDHLGVRAGAAAGRTPPPTP